MLMRDSGAPRLRLLLHRHLLQLDERRRERQGGEFRNSHRSDNVRVAQYVHASCEHAETVQVYSSHNTTALTLQHQRVLRVVVALHRVVGERQRGERRQFYSSPTTTAETLQSS